MISAVLTHESVIISLLTAICELKRALYGIKCVHKKDCLTNMAEHTVEEKKIRYRSLRNLKS
jgi:hypothetical protein